MPAQAARCAIEEARSECAEWESLANECEMRLADERARAAELEGELARARALAKAADPGEPDRDSLAKAIDLSSPTGILHTLEAFSTQTGSRCCPRRSRPPSGTR